MKLPGGKGGRVKLLVPQTQPGSAIAETVAYTWKINRARFLGQS